MHWRGMRDFGSTFGTSTITHSYSISEYSQQHRGKFWLPAESASQDMRRMKSSRVPDISTRRMAVYGGGGFAREVAWLAEVCGYHVVCFIDDDRTKVGRILNDIPVVSLADA